MRLRSDIELSPVTPALRRAAVEAGWFVGEDDNRVLGFGRGREGALRFMEGFFEPALSRDLEDPTFSLVGVYKAGKPAGFFSAEYLGAASRTVKLFFFLAPEERTPLAAPTALWLMLERLFERMHKSVFRVESEVLSINETAADFLRGMGFTQESMKRHAHWIGDQGPYDMLVFRMLRPEWIKQRYHEEAA